MRLHIHRHREIIVLHRIIICLRNDPYSYRTRIFSTHHPPCLVNVKPKRESLSTDTRTPTIPNPCDVTTCPLSTETRLLWFSYRFYSIFLCVCLCVILWKFSWFFCVVFRNRTKIYFEEGEAGKRHEIQKIRIQLFSK